jgi:hypothetical protein
LNCITILHYYSFNQKNSYTRQTGAPKRFDDELSVARMTLWKEMLVNKIPSKGEGLQ